MNNLKWVSVLLRRCAFRRLKPAARPGPEHGGSVSGSPDKDGLGAAEGVAGMSQLIDPPSRAQFDRLPAALDRGRDVPARRR